MEELPDQEIGERPGGLGSQGGRPDRRRREATHAQRGVVSALIFFRP
jgi:hypothetical protein